MSSPPSRALVDLAASVAGPGRAAQEAIDGAVRFWRSASRIGLASWFAVLALRAVIAGGGGNGSDVPPMWELQDSQRVVSWLTAYAGRAAVEAIWFAPVGFLAVASLWAGGSRFRRALSACGGFLFALVLAFLLQAVRGGLFGAVPGPLSMLMPAAGCAFGAWVGSAWVRGRRARRWLPIKVGVLLAAAGVTALLAFSLAMARTPLAFDPSPVSSEEKRRLVAMIRRNDPRKIKPGQTRTLEFTDHDINVLLSWGLSLGSPDRKAAVELNHDRLAFRASVGVPSQWRSLRYLNVQAEGRVSKRGGVFRLDMERCRIGQIDVPQPVLNVLSPFVTSELRHNRRTRPFLDAVESLYLAPGKLSVTYGPVDLPPGAREDLFGPIGLGPEMAAASRVYVQELAGLAERWEGKKLPFGMCLETVFRLAGKRSQEGDPVFENRAAVFALAILMGHHAVEQFVGSVTANIKIEPRARTLLWNASIRDRVDWRRHFLVSAAIAVLSAETVSDAAGLLKEELDAGAGGSGFSFGDLLADKAGTAFGVTATRDAASARAIQRRLSAGFVVDDFFPPAADLPEGIRAADFEKKYGGVGGEGYRAMVAEIERRVAACAAYR